MRKHPKIKYLNYRHPEFLQTIDIEENRIVRLFLKYDFKKIQHLRQ
ncbi:MAG: hypothetical protein ACFE8J_15030 [Candidatus Heimdallarchaeota archaeon]